ncbi:tRNA lysidine(34) synthetase TilS [Pollutimonas harenae]|uniref:tRNA(Ile)-lysidine synthase n=1 Tax=Pollutimonas harenae TaxID=657015 RepID=A0A853H7H3_9BURK|nr:tRNA lysidine(34) synthetase TilS [Pollutimonas harenae]NYT86453.1 tRNA lysidine(34) synthetase TilS [Pollutimonas harenae]TEA69799.1 tRNA lysidine(34) synthetase TilS [Pollutimonas harenae]
MLSPTFWQGFGSPSLSKAIVEAIAALPAAPRRIGIGLSGGADSAMLAVHAALYARRANIELHCFHIHHGLQVPADGWQAHVHDLAQMLQISCHTRFIQVDVSGGDGMESAAREMRYAALYELADLVGLNHILLAHHQNDQAETVLLRLLRGAGPAGLAAMAPVMQRQGLSYMRPWLGVERTLILQQADDFAHLTGWEPVSDPSNADDQYTRAALRERLTPELNERWPGWQGILARHARQSAEAAELLHELAEQDFAGLEPSPDMHSFSLLCWRALSTARQALVLRYWFGQQGLRMPTDARLQDLMRQLRGLHALGHDRHMRVKHGQVWIRCVKGRVFVEPAA